MSWLINTNVFNTFVQNYLGKHYLGNTATLMTSYCRDDAFISVLITLPIHNSI